MPRIIADGQPAGAGGGVATGDVSVAVEISSDISGIAPPAAGTLGSTAIPTLDHDGAGTTEEGQQVDFKVPDDYDSGDIELKITYAMSTSSGNNIRVSTAAIIADVVGNTIDSATYPKTWQTYTPHPTLDEPARDTFLTISSTDFDAGDTIQFQVTRNPGDGLDTHLGDWQVISYEISYTGQVATRESIQQIELFQNTDEPAPASGTLGSTSFATLDYSASADNEQKFKCIVPENWDGFSDLSVRLTYGLDGTSGGIVVLETEGDIADVSGNTTPSITSAKVQLPVGTTADVPYQSTIIRSIPATSLAPGDAVVLKVARRAGTDVSDTCTDLFQVITATVITGIGPKTGFEAVKITESYLYAHDFEVVSGIPTGSQDSPVLAGDFETWLKVTGNASADSMDVTFQGCLAADQSAITSIKIPVKGSWTTTAPTYQIFVYLEGAPTTNQYGASSAVATPVSRQLITLTSGDLTLDTPTGQKRFIIKVRTVMDPGESVYVGRPLVKQE
jgi:hypothetical protein